MGRYPFVLRLGTPGDLHEVRKLVCDAAEWLQRNKDTDQWAKPWPDRAGHRERMLNDLIKGKTWLVWDGRTAVATVTVDTEEPVDAQEKPVWPTSKRPERALYVRRVIVNRRYAGLGIGAALLDWTAQAAGRDFGARLVRIDVWTTNLSLHMYYKAQRFIPREARDPEDLIDYPSQALFERDADQAGMDYTRFFVEDFGERGT